MTTQQPLPFGPAPEAPRRLTVKEAALEGEIGMMQAADHADRVEPKWTDEAYHAVAYVVMRTDGEFTFEEIRHNAELSVGAPPDLRAWGIVARRAIREKFIVPTGTYRPRASGHCTPTPVYVRAQ